MLSKRFKVIEKLIEGKQDGVVVTLAEAIDILKKCPPVKFDQSVDISLKMGVDIKKADQQVRGTVSLPYGTGKTIKVLVFAKGDAVKQALDAGADYAGGDDLIEKVKNGWVDYDVVVSTPEFMREVGKLGKVLGPRGLMPTPKAGTVTNDPSKAIKELKAGKIEFKIDKNGLINNMVGKLSFKAEELIENIKTLVLAINRAKPSGAKGVYIKSLAISSTMGPGFKIDIQSLVTP